MKTKSMTIIMLALAAASFSPISNAALLEDRAKLEGAKTEAQRAATGTPADPELGKVATDKEHALSAFDAAAAAKFGPDWLTRWQNSAHPNPDDEAADIYIAGNPFDFFAKPQARISPTKQREVLAHIAAKPVIVTEDMFAVRFLPTYNADLAARLEELALHLPSRGVHGEEYFAFKHLAVLKKPTNGSASAPFHRHMTVAEWFDLASANAHFSPATFTVMRDYLLATTAKLLIDKRRADGQPVEGAEFDAAFAPVLVALKAPKFDGLSAAVTALQINLPIPKPDFTKQEAVAAAVADAAARKATFTTAWGESVTYPMGLGSVMFVMGETAYQEWRTRLINVR